MIHIDTSVLNPGTRKAAVPITIIPTGQACSLQVILTNDEAGVSLAGQSVITNFTSTGSLQTVNATLTAPAAGSYWVWVAVFVNGIMLRRALWKCAT